MSDNPFAYNSNTVTSSQPNSFKKAVDIMQGLVIFLAVLVLIYLFFIIPSQVDGSSMFPNLVNDEILLTNRLVQIAGGPGKPLKSYDYQRGDIVVFRKDTMDTDLVKRVIGLPGESIKIEGGSFYINGHKLTENYIDTATYPTQPDTFLPEGVEKQIPADSYVLVGDNRPGSRDSRSADVGFVKRSEIKGAPFVRVYPLNKFSLLKRGKYTLGS